MTRILLVDDEGPVVDELSAFLSRAGHEVTGCVSLDGARVALESSTFDVMVLDVRMGKKSAVDWLASTEWALRVPTLLLSGIADLDEVLRGLAVGAFDFVHKTEPVESIVLAVEELCSSSARLDRSTASVDFDVERDVRELSEVSRDECEDALFGGRLEYVAQISQRGELHLLMRERDAMELSQIQRRLLVELAKGESAKVIADLLGLSAPALSKLLEATRRDLGFRDARQLRRLLGALVRR